MSEYLLREAARYPMASGRRLDGLVVKVAREFLIGGGSMILWGRFGAGLEIGAGWRRRGTEAHCLTVIEQPFTLHWLRRGQRG